MGKFYRICCLGILSLLAGFHVCQAQDPSTMCETAPIFCDLNELDSYTFSMSDIPTAPVPDPLCPDGNGFANNMNWFAFVAQSSPVTIEVIPSNCNVIDQGNGPLTGIQVGIYEDCDYANAIFCNPVCSTAPTIVNTPVEIGEVYHIFLDGCGGSVCDIEINIIGGGGDVTLDDQMTINDETPSGRIEVCRSSVPFELFTNESNISDAEYVFTLPDGSEVNNGTNPVITYTFDTEGDFNVCVFTQYACDTLDTRLCVPVRVTQAPDEDTEVTFCEGDTETLDGYTMNGGPITITEGGLQSFTDVLNMANCLITLEVDATVIEENDENPTIIDTVLCVEDGPFTLADGTVVEECTMMDVMILTPAGCDSFLMYDITYLDGSIRQVGDVMCNNGIYTIDAIAEQSGGSCNPATVNYQWLDPDGNEIPGATMPTLNVEVVPPGGSYTVTASLELDGVTCDLSPVTIPVNTADFLPPTPTEIIGADDVCLGDVETYTISSIGNDIIDYQWTVPVGAIITEGQGLVTITVDFSFSESGQVCLQGAFNACGTFLDGPVCIDVTVNPPPIPNAGEDRTFCGTDTVVTLEAELNGDNGQWTVVDGPGSVIFSDPSMPNSTMTVTEPGSYLLAWTDRFGDCGAEDQVIITFFEQPSAGALSEDCTSGANYVLTFDIEGGMEPFTVLSGNGSVTGSLFTSDVLLAADSYIVTIEDANGCLVEVASGPVDCDCNNMAGTMSDELLTACVDETVQAVYNDDAVLDGDDSTAYILHTNSGLLLGDIIDINDTGEFAFIPDNMEPGVTYYISFVAGNDTTGMDDFDRTNCLAVAQGQPVIWYAYPEADAGADVMQCEASLQLAAVRSTGVGRWISLTGPGAITISDSTEAVATFGADAPGVYELVWLEDNNGCTDQDTVLIEFYEIPEAVNILTECNQAADQFVLSFEISGGTAPYTIVRGGGTITGSTYTSDVLPKDTNYDVVIEDANGCEIVPVTGIESCICESEVGTMDQTRLDLCEDELSSIIYDPTSEMYDGDDTTSFVLHSSGTSTLVDIIAVNSTGAFNFNPATMVYEQTYFVSAIVGDRNGDFVNLLDGCLVAAVGTPVRWFENPTADAGNTARTCDFEFDLAAIPSVGTGSWRYIDGPAASVNFDNPSSATTGTTGTDQFGDYRFEWTESNNGCIDRDTVTVTVVDFPMVDETEILYTCNDANTSYRVRFPITGGDPGSYDFESTNGGTIIGGNFVIAGGVASGSPFSVRIWDATGCDTTLVTGFFECPCETVVGSMSPELVELCEDELFVVDYDNTGETRDGDDVLFYVLHDSPTETLGTIFFFGTDLSIPFTAATLNYGQTYYISAVLGSPDGPFIAVGADDCFDVAAGTPVIWYEEPDAVIDTDRLALTCAEPELMLDASMSVPAGNLSYSWLTENGGTISGDAAAETVTVLSAGRYILTVTNGACMASDTVEITFDGDLPVAEATVTEVLTCDVNQVMLDGTGSDTGPDIIYVWTNEAGDTVSTDINATATTPGNYTLRVINVATGCPAASSVTVAIDTVAPMIVIGTVGELTCDTEQTSIDISASSSGANFDIQWTTDDGLIVGGETSTIVSVGQAGDYTVTITNTVNGCSSSRTVSVQEMGNTFSNFSATPQDILCNGDADGMISINVDGGIDPIEYSFDGGNTFSSVATASGLQQGEYTVVVRDANGCTIGETVTISQPDPVLLQLPADTTLEFGESIDLIAEFSGGDIEWQSSDSSFSCIVLDNCSEISATPIITSTYTATVTNANGCSVTDQVVVRVQVSRKIYIPNVFSPNADGRNDLWGIFGQETVEIIDVMQVYDRWGTKVFEARNIPPNSPEEFGWDGNYQGEQCLPGVYTYFAQVRFRDGFQRDLAGDVTLVR